MLREIKDYELSFKLIDSEVSRGRSRGGVQWLVRQGLGARERSEVRILHRNG